MSRKPSFKGHTLPIGAKNYVTPFGFDTLQKELQNLLSIERPSVVEKVAWAASNGDRSENADYHYGKKRLREIDSRIRFLQKRLDAACIIDPKSVRFDDIRFGATVTLLDEDERQRTFQIVGIDEANPTAGKISWISPLAKNLLQKKEGDIVIHQMPKGEKELEIIRIEYL